MSRRGVTAALVAALMCLGASAPAHAADQAVYDLVRGCYALKAPSGYVAKTQGGYTASAPSAVEAEPFRMQATALGRYLFYGPARDFMGGGAGPGGVQADGVEAQPLADPSADWAVESVGPGAFTVALPSESKALAAVDGALRLVDPGWATAFAFEETQGCSVFPEVELNAFGTPGQSRTWYGETRGFVDGHMHMMAFEFLGGGAHCGRPWHPYGVEYALVDCPDHATGGAPLETAVSSGVGPTHDPVGWPTFKDWPAWGSLTHEQSYYRWVERAWMGGLRVYTNLFVDNAVLCELYPVGRRNGCNEMESVRLQARRIREMEDYIDAQAGGPGRGFFRIVTDPFEARRVINDGKLAVILGIEVSKLFDCGIYNGVPECNREMIDRQLDEVYDMGVRQMELINKFDNALGGVAGDAGETGVVVNQGNKYETGEYWDFKTCTDGHSHDREQISAAGHNDDALVGNGLQAFLPIAGQAPVYPAPPHCNTYGLSPLGEYTVRRMIDKGMIIDPDHLSVLARKQLLAVTEAEDYSGLVSSHSWSTPDAYPRIYEAGGVVTPYAGSSTGFVEQWRELRDERSGRYYYGFGYGADMNGLGAQGPPRNPTDNPVTYPFKSFDGKVQLNQQRSGSRVYDINSDGVAHYGLYPDWIEDLRKLAGDQIVEDMARGPEAYLQMWERAIGVPSPAKCHPARWTFFRGGLGKVVLRRDPVALLTRAGQPVRRVGRTYRYCVRGRKNRKGQRVAAVFTPRQRVGLVVSNSRSHKLGKRGRSKRARLLRKLGRGSSAKRLRKVTRRFGRGLRIRNAGRRARVVYGVRRGRVRFVAVATRQVAKSPRRVRGYLRRAGVR